MGFSKEKANVDAGAWIGPQIQDDPNWVHQLDDSAIAEIENALANLHELKVQIPFGADAFPTPHIRCQASKNPR